MGRPFGAAVSRFIMSFTFPISLLFTDYFFRFPAFARCAVGWATCFPRSAGRVRSFAYSVLATVMFMKVITTPSIRSSIVR